MQQKFNRDMAAAVKDLKAAGGLHAAWVLAFVSFMYGVLHAAGPGHGKAVISSYVLANERTVRRGIFLSFLAAFFQALSAIAIVGVLAIALNATSLTIKSTEHWIETLSWALGRRDRRLDALWADVKKLMAQAGGERRPRDTHDAHACCGHDHSRSRCAHAHDHEPHAQP